MTSNVGLTEEINNLTQKFEQEIADSRRILDRKASESKESIQEMINSINMEAQKASTALEKAKKSQAFVESALENAIKFIDSISREPVHDQSINPRDGAHLPKPGSGKYCNMTPIQPVEESSLVVRDVAISEDKDSNADEERQVVPEKSAAPHDI